MAGFVVLVVLHGVVHAQAPAQPQAPYPSPSASAPPQAYPYASQPYPASQSLPPGAMVPPPYQFVPVQLTEDEQRLLSEGEIPDGKYVGGALLAVFVGYGLGQAVQGRYGDTGWIFTVGDAGSAIALFAGLFKSIDSCFATEGSCSNNSGEALLIGGAIGLVVFRTWELIDAFAVPPRHNARVRQLRLRLGLPPAMYSKKLQPYVVPTLSRDGGGVAGVMLRF